MQSKQRMEDQVVTPDLPVLDRYFVQSNRDEDLSTRPQCWVDCVLFLLFLPVVPSRRTSFVGWVSAS